MNLLPLSEYQKIIVAFSGGKDSLAAVLKLLEMGIPKSRIELWHHDIDGAPGSRGLMDWPCTRSYVKAAAAALGLDLYFSWREGGFEREMLREGTATAPVVIDWKETEVWAIMEKHRIRPDPAYELGWGRVSCALCIFGDKNQWRSPRELMPERFVRVAAYEKQFGVTIKRKLSIEQLADQGQSFLPEDRDLRALALSEEYPQDLILVGSGETWKLPWGAYKHGGGPS